jgi:hypothetical protein
MRSKGLQISPARSDRLHVLILDVRVLGKPCETCWSSLSEFACLSESFMLKLYSWKIKLVRRLRSQEIGVWCKRGTSQARRRRLDVVGRVKSLLESEYPRPPCLGLRPATNGNADRERRSRLNFISSYLPSKIRKPNYPYIFDFSGRKKDITSLRLAMSRERVGCVSQTTI